MKRVGNRQLFADLAIADARLAGREWFFSHFTAVDAYFFWCFRRAKSFKLDVSAFASCEAHFERMSGRESVRKVVAYEKEVQASFSGAAA